MVLCGVVMENTQENMENWKKWGITSILALLISVHAPFPKAALTRITRMEVTLKSLK